MNRRINHPAGLLRYLSTICGASLNLALDRNGAFYFTAQRQLVLSGGVRQPPHRSADTTARLDLA